MQISISAASFRGVPIDFSLSQERKAICLSVGSKALMSFSMAMMERYSVL
jgi:hypothetical protein